jgi:endonuclease/exonuclease/phosphatase family metal-dependent hydrolase
VSTDSTSSLRVLTYNIAHGRGPTDDNWKGTAAERRDRIQAIAKLLTDSKADLIVLNEVDFDSTWSGHQNQAEAIAQAAGFPNWVEHRNLDFRSIYGSLKSGNAILSRYPIVDSKLVRYPTLRTAERILAGHKQGIVCTLQISESQQLRVIAVHLEHRSEDIRVQSALKIIETVEESEIPLIAIGDFNSTPSSLPDAEFDSNGNNAMDVLFGSNNFSVAPLTTKADESNMTFPAVKPAWIIDWILIPNTWSFSGHRVLDDHLSDHRPVVADLLIPR